MSLFSAKTRIAVGLACLLVSVLCTAMMLGIVPDRRSAVLAGRADLCEAIAMTSSDHISRNELRRLEFLLQAVVERNDDILSAGVRRTDGNLIATVGNHAVLWQLELGDRSSESQVHVPIRSGQEKWGNIELRFHPLQESGFAGYWKNPWLQMTLFVTATSYLLFLVYLRKMLAHLDPSKTVPRRVRSALDSLAEGLLVIDKDQRIVLANQSFAGWIGRDPDKLIGVHAAKIDWVKNEQGDSLDEFPWVQAIRLESPQAGVMLGLKRKDKPIRIMMANASPVLGHDGKYRGVLVSFDDVTQLEETKKDLRVAKQIADDANQAKSAFLARMSHEIRTPMNAILGYTDVLRRGFDDSVENRQEYLDTIHGSGEHLLALINDILDLSKVEAGQMELEITRCSPHKTIQQVMTLLRSKADEKGIALEFRCDGQLPETILTDPVRLRQTVMNLAGNAIKFTDKGGVTIVARLTDPDVGQRMGRKKDLADAQLAVDVIDTGIGIPKAVQDRIFEPFAQADSSVTRRFGGTGLGLAISKQLAEALGGGIKIKSKEGKGSTFTVTIGTGPLQGIRMIDEFGPCKVENERQSAKQELIHLPPARILVADDGESNRKLIELVLGRAGARVVSVENGKRALDRALKDPFDLILMDMQMPVMDGYTASTRLREAGYEQPIIALTAHAMRGDEEKCRAAGCSGFLTKPIDIDHLLATLGQLLAKTPPVEHSRTLAKNDVKERSAETPRPIETASIKSPTSKSGATADAPGPLSDDPEYREIVNDFILLMRDQMNDMRDAVARKSYSTVESLAHSLRGAAGTFGFDQITEPAAQIERHANERRFDALQVAIADLEQIAVQVMASQAPPRVMEEVRLKTKEPSQVDRHLSSTPGASMEPPSEPLQSSLPMDDADFREIVEEFVERLNTKLEAMERAWNARDFDELAALAHWLKGSGGTAGFDAFTTPAKALEQMAKQGNSEMASTVIADLRNLVDRIAIPIPA